MRVMKVIGLLMVSLFFSSAFAQEPARCGTDDLFEQQLQDPKFKRSYFKLEEIAKEVEEAKRTSFMPDLPITVPVIVHVIHFGEPYGVDNHLPIEYVQEAIDNANQNFAGEFSDNPTANTQINFCIANASTSGASIEGIRYYNWDDLGLGSWGSSPITYEAPDISDLIGYDRDNYCNIFVVPFMSPLGFAWIPPTNYGVFVGTYWFGLTGYSNQYNQNRTLVHELGHYCGLYHTFHNTSTCDPTGNCTSQGDAVCDTPPTTGNAGCPSNGGACGNDLVENYMDYSSDNCMDSFTQGQALRMLSRLEIARPGVVSNTLACGAIDGIDVGVSGVNMLNTGCDPIQDVEFILTNYGDTLTETTINYTINNEESFIIWTGNLGFGESETITLSNLDVGYGLIDIEVNVDALGDVYPDNNTQSVQLDNYEGSFVDIIVEWDALPYGIDIELFEADSSGNPIGDALFLYEPPNNDFSCTVDTFTFCLSEGNYAVVANDLFGNGMHYPCVPDFVDRCIWVEINGEMVGDALCGGWSNGTSIPFTVGPPICSPATCYGDVDGNGFIWASDILLMLQYFGLEVEPCSPFDTDQDGIVGVTDILDVIANFDSSCDGQLVPEEGFEVFLRNEYEGELVTTILYNMMGQKVQNTNYLDTGIYIIVQEWNVPDVGLVITKQKIYR